MQNTGATKKILTLCLLDDGARVLLGMKKRGFGMGKWNGFGGKVEEGETIEEAACRELFEESNVHVDSFEKCGVMDLIYLHTDTLFEIHIFRSSSWSGEVQETEEMRPAWYAYDDIPLHLMWANDIHWYPYYFERKKFKGRFVFKDYETLVEHEVEILEEGVWNPVHASAERG